MVTNFYLQVLVFLGELVLQSTYIQIWKIFNLAAADKL